MAQSSRNARLETRTVRLKLPKGKRNFQRLADGVGLIYRRTGEGFGTWTAKIARREAGRWKYSLRLLGGADDFADADGQSILTFAQAQEKARRVAKEAKADGGTLTRPLTVGEAADRYLEWFRIHRKGVGMAESAIRAHIKPKLGDRLVADLTARDLSRWLEEVAASPARLRTGINAKQRNERPVATTDEEKRARKASANRNFSVFKALLNKAFRDGHVGDDIAWRKVSPFRNADQARIRSLSVDEAIRLINACPEDLRALVHAALLTGARWGELAALRACNVIESSGMVHIYISDSKSGKPRRITLNREGRERFRALALGKSSDEYVFTRSDGRPWGRNTHRRALAKACAAARIAPAIRFHELRHTFGSLLAEKGVDLLRIAKLLGHADTRVTMRHYAHLTDRTLAEAAEQLPGLSGDGRIHLIPVVGGMAA